MSDREAPERSEGKSASGRVAGAEGGVMRPNVGGAEAPRKGVRYRLSASLQSSIGLNSLKRETISWSLSPTKIQALVRRRGPSTKCSRPVKQDRPRTPPRGPTRVSRYTLQLRSL